MTEQQLKTIVGLFAGMQAAMVHLSNVMCVNAGISPEAMATSFEEFGAAIPESAPHRQMMQIVCRQVACGIRDSAAGEEWSQLVARLLH